MTQKPPPPPFLRNLDNFPAGDFIQPSIIRHKRVFNNLLSLSKLGSTGKKKPSCAENAYFQY